MQKLILAYYHLVHLTDPEEEVRLHKEFLSRCDAKARIYISKQGINGQMSIAAGDGKAYMEWLASRSPFQGVTFKIQEHPEHVFPRLTIKCKKELVALGKEVSIDDRGTYLTAHEWAQTLADDSEKIVLDTRNDYEWKLGRFVGAELFPCTTFKEFTHSVAALKSRVQGKDTKVLMYCTGGIRCELFSALLKQEGINNVFQLEGGIIRYGQLEKTKHWQGKLFVFDDRLACSLTPNTEAEVIGTCHHCNKSIEAYYNCANMDCNELFLCCPECLDRFKGCCQESCMHKERVRPYKYVGKPFRRWHHYAKTKEQLKSLHEEKATNNC